MPPTDPRFLAATRDDILVDLWAHRHADDPSLANEVVMDDDAFAADLAEMEAEALAAAEAAGEEWEEVASDTFGGAA